MPFIERPIGTDRQADAVKRQLVSFADGRQVTMRWSTGAHVIFGMDFEESDIGKRFDDGAVMLGLEADAPAGRNAILWR